MNDTAEISLHEEYLSAAFDTLLSAEMESSRIDGEMTKATALLKIQKAEADTAVVNAWQAIKSLMDETGEAEVVLAAGNGTWNKIYYTTARENLKVEADAVPDEFCKIERKPKLREIGEYLKTTDNLPNWCRYEKGESKLAWRNVKHKGESNG